jgi:Xaa-Pro aminopeptidase
MFEDVRSHMKPGVRLVDIQRRYLDQVREGGFEPGGALMHGRGLGDDFPLVWGNRPIEDESLALQDGMVFILKPAAFPAGGTEELVQDGEVVELALRAGDTVVVTARGAERLGRREMELVEL